MLVCKHCIPATPESSKLIGFLVMPWASGFHRSIKNHYAFMGISAIITLLWPYQPSLRFLWAYQLSISFSWAHQPYNYKDRWNACKGTWFFYAVQNRLNWHWVLNPGLKEVRYVLIAPSVTSVARQTQDMRTKQSITSTQIINIIIYIYIHTNALAYKHLISLYIWMCVYLCVSVYVCMCACVSLCVCVEQHYLTSNLNSRITTFLSKNGWLSWLRLPCIQAVVTHRSTNHAQQCLTHVVFSDGH